MHAKYSQKVPKLQYVVNLNSFTGFMVQTSPNPVPWFFPKDN